MEAAPTDAKSIFSSFTKNKKEMDGRQWSKFVKDSKLLKKNVMTSTDVDIIFSKIKPRGLRKINLKQFQAGCVEIGKKLGLSGEEVLAKAGAAGGPKFKGTKADYVKFHDDKTTYTGVYAKGGPTNVDTRSGKISNLDQLCDRSDANVRGVKKN